MIATNINSGTTLARRYLDVAGAAEYLCMTEGAVYVAKARKQIPFRKQGRKLVFDKVALDAYMQSLEGVDVDEAVERRLYNGTLNNFKT